MSAYSHPALVDTLSKVNREKLYRMMRDDFPVGKVIEGTGFKVPYRHRSRSTDALFVCVIAGEFKRLEQKVSSDRETVLVRRFNPEKFSQWIQNKWNPSTQEWEPAPLEEQVLHYMKNATDEVKPVYKDRLTKAEITKLSLLHLVEPGTYVEGLGGVQMNARYETYSDQEGRLRGQKVPNERVYFIQGGKSEGVS
jgi:hypothetical protein